MRARTHGVLKQQNVEKWKHRIQHHVRNNSNNKKWWHTLKLNIKKNNKHEAYTPWKINMEPTHHPFRKEHDHDLPNLYEYLLQGCRPSHWLSDFFW